MFTIEQTMNCLRIDLIKRSWPISEKIIFIKTNPIFGKYIRDVLSSNVSATIYFDWRLKKETDTEILIPSSISFTTGGITNVGFYEMISILNNKECLSFVKGHHTYESVKDLTRTELDILEFENDVCRNT